MKILSNDYLAPAKTKTMQLHHTYLSGLKNTLLYRGILAISFGCFALFMPGVTLHLFTLVFGILVITDGLISIVSSLSKVKEEHSWWYLLLQGLFSLFIGALILRSPFLTDILIVIYVAIWLLNIGVLEIITAIRLHRFIKGEFWYIISGAVSILTALIILADPMGGIWSLTWLIGVNSLIFGTIMLWMGFRLSRRIPLLK